ncbi:MAG: outer membrane protein assembly factor BamA, partial [Nitrospinota bacterium]
YASSDSPTIKDLAIEGIWKSNIDTIKFYISSTVGSQLDRKKVRADVLAIYKLGIFDKVRVNLDNIEGGVRLTYVLKEKPFIREVIVNGIKNVSEKELLLGVKTAKGSFFRQDYIPWDVSRIKKTYQSKGYYSATVEVKVHKIEDNLVDIEYIIDENEKIVIHSITFDGVNAFSDATLKNIMQTKTARWGSTYGDKGVFKKDLLKADLLSIESYYHDHGFVKIKLFEPEIEVDKERRNVYLRLSLIENDQYRVGDIEIEGDDIYSSPELRKWLTLSSGDIFNRALLRKYIFDTTDRYSEKGYAYAQIQTESKINEESKLVDIKITPQKGRKVYIGNIVISGNSTTRDRVIRRELRFAEGEVYNSKKLKISKDKINMLGFFESVDFDQRARPESDLVDIDVRVADKNIGQMMLSLGYNSEEHLLVQAQVQWDNLLGKGQKLSFTAEKSSIRDDISIGFTEPALFDRNLLVGAKVYKGNYTPDIDDGSYNSKTDGYILRAGRSLSTNLFGQIGYKQESTDVTITDKDEASIYLLEQEGLLNIRSIFPSITYDTRNDPYGPTSGMRAKLYTEYAGIGGGAKFYKLRGELLKYQSLSGGFVGAAQGKIGWVESLDDNSVPITERFFMGGPSSLRGFSYHDIGPKEENGAAIGGEASLIFNLELQYLFTRYFRSFLFYDRGNVYGKEDLRNNTTANYYDLGEMRSSWGLGIHFFSPLGPITLAYGIKLDRQEEETPSEFHFSIGGVF